MNNVNKVNVSLKCRIGLGKRFNYNFFAEFIDEVTKSGIDVVYVHARNAILNGISPKENRSIPPLNYDFVRKIKLDFPKIKFILNGGIKSLNEALSLRKEFDGVMIGRLIQNNPFCLIDVDELFFNSKNQKKIKEKIILEYFYYIKQKTENESIFRLLSPLLQIFFGTPNSKKFKIKINEKIKKREFDQLESLFLQFVNQ